MSSQEQKINSLLDRIRQENSPTNSPQMSGQPARNYGDLPVSLPRPSLPLSIRPGTRRPQDLTFTPRSNDNLETDRKLREIMKISGNLTIKGQTYKTDIKDMERLEELGNGTCGHVVKMRHKPSNEIIAVKQMRRSGNNEENKRIIMDIEVVLKSHDCNYIVQCLGCFITDSEVWICMELMTTCFDKLLKRLGKPIPEEILGKVTVATVEALSYLKDKHGVIHRDVKPSNILLDTKGYVKLCDFGISGRLVDSMAKTRSAGCAAYLAPERIEPDPENPDYDIRADVWSLGITLVELATGVFPYPDCNTDFEVLTKVIGQDPPSLPDTFSGEFRDFVKCCLTKDQKQRPKYLKLKNHPFIKKYATRNVNVGDWVVNAIQQADSVTNRGAPRPSAAQSIRRFFTSTHQQRQQPVANVAAPPPPAAASSQIPVHKVTNGNPQCQYKQLKMPEPSEARDIPPGLQRPGGGGGGGGGGHTSRLSTFQSSASNHQREGFQPYSYQRNDPFLPIQEPNPFKPCSPFRAYQNHIAAAARLQQNAQAHAASPPEDARADLRFSPTVQRKNSSDATDGDRSGATFNSSALAQRKVSGDRGGVGGGGSSSSRWRSPSASPLPLRSHFQANQEQQYNCGNTSPIILQRFYHQQKQQQLAKEAEEAGKKRFASYIKLQLNCDHTGRSSRHQSPEPPPRLNRTISSDSQSPLTIRRGFLESPASSSLSKRYVSPAPPLPPPRRLSESNSVPGSPQHLRARFHYTPEPQRRLFQNNDVT